MATTTYKLFSSLTEEEKKNVTSIIKDSPDSKNNNVLYFLIDKDLNDVNDFMNGSIVIIETDKLKKIKKYSKMTKENFKEFLTVKITTTAGKPTYEFVNFPNYAVILSYFEKYFDFHNWYDDTSRDIITNKGKTSASAALQSLDLDKISPFHTGKLTVGGVAGDCNNFYKNVLDNINKLLLNDSIAPDFNIMYLFCIGNNVSYWLAKRYLYQTIGDYKLEDESKTLSDWITSDDQIVIKQIYEKLYNVALTNQNDNKELFAENYFIYMMYQYLILSGIANQSKDVKMDGDNVQTQNDYKKTGTADADERETNYKKSYSLFAYTDTSILKHREIARWIFKKFGPSFQRKHNEVEYKEKSSIGELKITSKPLNITGLIRERGNEINDGMSLEQKFKFNKFYAINTMKQVAGNYPKLLCGGKFFCGGDNNMFNGSKLYNSIFENIKDKLKKLDISLNNNDEEKIKKLIKVTSELEDDLYNILSTLSKFVSIDPENKHKEISYEQIVDQVEKYTKELDLYNKKSIIIFRDLAKIGNAILRVANGHLEVL